MKKAFYSSLFIHGLIFVFIFITLPKIKIKEIDYISVEIINEGVKKEVEKKVVKEIKVLGEKLEYSISRCKPGDYEIKLIGDLNGDGYWTIGNIEKKILIEMLANPGKTYSRIQIGEISNITQERSIDVMITRLRQKIEVNPKNPKYLQTIRGSGYVLWIE